MEHNCKYEEKLLEMYGDIKTLVAEFKAMNGSLKATTEEFKKHDLDSQEFRYKVNITWFILQGFKYALISGLVWRGFEFIHYMLTR